MNVGRLHKGFSKGNSQGNTELPFFIIRGGVSSIQSDEIGGLSQLRKPHVVPQERDSWGQFGLQIYERLRSVNLGLIEEVKDEKAN